MTYEEREKQLCRECSMKETCPYIPRKMEYKCQHLSDTMYGWELGWRDSIDKAVEWLKTHINDYLVKGRDIDYMFDDFSKAMEEQQ